MGTKLTLPLGFGDLDFSDWVRGLVAAFISGGASAVTSGIVVSVKDPDHYAPMTHNFFELVGAVFVMSGIVSAMAFLRNKPLPEVKTVTTTTQKTEKVGEPPAKVVTTVQETHVEPLEPKQGE